MSDEEDKPEHKVFQLLPGEKVSEEEALATEVAGLRESVDALSQLIRSASDAKVLNAVLLAIVSAVITSSVISLLVSLLLK